MVVVGVSVVVVLMVVVMSVVVVFGGGGGCFCWHFDETEQYDPKTKTGGLFTDYVNTFLKMKQEASGWPEWCQSENDKWRYIRDYHEKEGILLDYNNIKNNHGRDPTCLR